MYGPKTRAALPQLKQLGGPAQTVLLKAVKENKTLQDKTAWVDLVQQAVKGKPSKEKSWLFYWQVMVPSFVDFDPK